MGAAVSSGLLVKRFTELPLQGLKAWSDQVPFKMDALGIFTLLSAYQVSTAIGSLQRRRYTGALSLLAAFVLAGDRFTSIEPGFALSNVTDGMTVREIHEMGHVPENQQRHDRVQMEAPADGS